MLLALTQAGDVEGSPNPDYRDILSKAHEEPRRGRGTRKEPRSGGSRRRPAVTYNLSSRAAQRAELIKADPEPSVDAEALVVSTISDHILKE